MVDQEKFQRDSVFYQLEHNYNFEKMRFLAENRDKKEKDFINIKLNLYRTRLNEMQRVFNLSDSDFKNEVKNTPKHLIRLSTLNDQNEINIYLDRVVEFSRSINKPENQVNNINHILFYETKLNNIPFEENVLESDLSNSNAVQKIIYLKELGIIDLLLKEPCFTSSTNNLAKVITAITGEKISTIQPYLNVLINKTGNENNNPYKSETTVEKVKNHLINLGFKPK